MKRIISNNDMNNPGEGHPPVLDLITRKFLKKMFVLLREKDAIAIMGSCIVALTLEQHGDSSFLPGDIDIFVKQDLKLEDQIFDRYFLHSSILLPLSIEGINWQPKEIPITKSLTSKYTKYRSCKINILHIIEISLFQQNKEVNAEIVNRPKIQIIIVGDETDILQELPVLSLTPFEKKGITSFDIDIVKGIYNPMTDGIVFAHPEIKQNVLNMTFWYICDVERPFSLLSTIKRVKKYSDRGFTWKGFKSIDNPSLTISSAKFKLTDPQSLQFSINDYVNFAP